MPKFKMMPFFMGAAALGLLGSLSVMARDEDSPPEAFVVHEWGTFTALQGSDGKNLEGLHHEEEKLPAFVSGRCGSSSVHGDSKCADFHPRAGTPLAVTQKMETPVIYFYGSAPQKAQVTVGFPRGIISQWFPEAASYTPEIGEVDKVADGSMTWNVDILPPEVSLSDEPPAGSSWLHARDVDANVVKVGDSTEKFIFYRGLGQFDTDLRIQSDETGKLTVVNSSTETVPAAILLGYDGHKGFSRPLGQVAAESSLTLAEIPAFQADGSDYLALAQSQVEQALIDSGLFQKEAHAMVKTWEHSYFLTPGLRVLYVLPRSWSDTLLPLEITPKPEATVRTLVGRVEIMTRSEEQAALQQLQAALDEQKSYSLAGWGRLKEAKLRRLHGLAESIALKNAINVALKRLGRCEMFPCR